MLEKLKRKLPEVSGQEDLLNDLISDATDTVLDIIGRDVLPQRLESVVIALAVIAYERMGTEGNSSRTEGGISLSFVDGLPADLQTRLTNYPRKVRVIGNAPKIE